MDVVPSFGRIGIVGGEGWFVPEQVGSVPEQHGVAAVVLASGSGIQGGRVVGVLTASGGEERLRHHGHGAVEVLLLGAVGVDLEPAVELGANTDAPLLVCGSRKMNAVTRLFFASVASELAARAKVPVTVVP